MNEDVTAAAHGASPIAQERDVGKFKLTLEEETDESNALLAPVDGYTGTYFTVIGHGEHQNALAKRIVKAVNFHDALVNALGEMIAAIDANAIDSEMLPGEPEVGIHPHKWHDEWAHYVRAILASLHREAIAEKPSSFEGVNPEAPTKDSSNE